MKNLKFLTIGLFILSACSSPVKKEEEQKLPLVETFMSQMWVKGNKAVGPTSSESEQLVALMDLSIGQVLEGKVKAYDPFWSPGEEGIEVSVESALETVVRIDTLYIEQPDDPYDLLMVVSADTFAGNNLSGLRTYESWYVSDNYSISKNVSHYQPTRENLDPTTGDVRGWTPMYAMPNPVAEGDPVKVVSVRYFQQIVNKQYDDSQWYRENIEPSLREEFIGGLLAEAKSGELSGYADPTGKTMLTKEAMASSLSRIDTFYVEAPEPPYDLSMEVKSREYDWGDIVALEFVQDVKYYHNGAVEINVKAYGAVIIPSDPVTGQPMGEQTLFWIKCD